LSCNLQSVIYVLYNSGTELGASGDEIVGRYLMSVKIDYDLQGLL